MIQVRMARRNNLPLKEMASHPGSQMADFSVDSQGSANCGHFERCAILSSQVFVRFAVVDELLVGPVELQFPALAVGNIGQVAERRGPMPLFYIGI